MTRQLPIALLILALTGCATTDGLRYYVNGPVAYVTGDALAVRALCTRLLAKGDNHGAKAGRARGCAAWTRTTAIIACPEGDDECVAHELHHVVDPDWRHE